jgi:hypothetical protein
MKTIVLILILIVATLAAYYPTQNEKNGYKINDFKGQISKHETYYKQYGKEKVSMSIPKRPINPTQEKTKLKYRKNKYDDPTTITSESSSSSSSSSSSDEETRVRKKPKKNMNFKFKKSNAKYEDCKYTAPVYYRRR